MAKQDHTKVAEEVIAKVKEASKSNGFMAVILRQAGDDIYLDRVTYRFGYENFRQSLDLIEQDMNKELNSRGLSMMSSSSHNLRLVSPEEPEEPPAEPESTEDS